MVAAQAEDPGAGGPRGFAREDGGEGGGAGARARATGRRGLRLLPDVLPGGAAGDGEADSSEEEYATGWVLEDESGRIEVEPQGAEIKGLRARTFSPGGAARVPESRPELLARYLRAHEARMGLRTDLREERLELGTTVVAVGWVREGPRGLVLTGGSELQVFGETEKELTSIHGSDVVGGVLLAAGLLLCAAGVSALG